MNETDTYYVAVDDKTIGPVTPAQVRAAIRRGVLNADADICRVGDDAWTPLGEHAVFAGLFQRGADTEAASTGLEPEPDAEHEQDTTSSSLDAGAIRPIAPPGHAPSRLESPWIRVAIGASIAVALALVAGALTTRFGGHPAEPSSTAARPPPGACEPACTDAQTCESGACRDRPPDAHLPALVGVGSFTVGRDAADALVANDRVFVATRDGVEVHSGGLVTVVRDARGSNALVRVGELVYATRARTVSAIDIATARMLARMELHGTAGRPVTLGDASRVLVPVGDRHEVAVIYPALHAVLPAVPFDVGIGAVAVSPDGARAVAVSGRTTQVRVRWGRYSFATGRTRTVGSTVFAFDPGRSTFQADHARLEVGGEPWAALFTSNDEALVALREENALVPVQWTSDGVTIGARLTTCESPDLLLSRPRSEHVVVGCGRAVALATHGGELVHAWTIAGDVVDVLVSPDGTEAYVAHALEVPGLPTVGAITTIDLASNAVATIHLPAEPTAQALYEDGRTLAVLVDREVLLFGAERPTERQEVVDPPVGATRLSLTSRATVGVGGRPVSIIMGGEPERIFVGTVTGREVVVVDPADGAIVWRLRAGHAVEDVDLLHGRWLTAFQYIGSSSMSVWDLASQQPEGEPPVRQTLRVGRNVGDVLELDDGESALVTSVDDHRLHRFRLTTMESTGDVRLPRACGSLVPVQVHGRMQAAVMGGVFSIGLFSGHSTPIGAWIDLVDLDAEPFGSRRRALSAGQQPREPGVTSDGTTLLFPDRMSNQVTRVHVETDEAPATVGVGREPEAVAVLSDDERAVSIDAASSTVTVLRIDPLERLGALSVAHAPRALAVSRAGGFVAVALTGNGFPGNGSGVVLLSGSPLAIVASAETGPGPYDVAVSDDGRLVATANSADGTISVFEVNTAPAVPQGSGAGESSR